MILLARLAWRNLLRNRRRTLLTVCSIGIGLAALIFQQSLLKTVQAQAIERATAYWTGHLVIHAKGFQDKKSIDYRMENPDQVRRAVADLPRLVSWSERLYFSGLASSPSNSMGVMMAGVDPVREQTVTTMHTQIVQGRELVPADDRAIVLGEKSVSELGVELGDKVVVMTQAADGALAAEAFRLVGVIKTGKSDFVIRGGHIPLKAAQRMLGVGRAVSEIVVTVQSPREVAPLVDWLEARVDPEAYEVLSWKELLSWIDGMTQFQDAVLWVVLCIVFAIVSFGILNTLLMSVLERVREFGVLMAIGTTPMQVVGIVMWEAFFLGTLGMIAGDGFGAAIVAVYHRRGLPLPLSKAFQDSFPFGDVLYLDLPLYYFAVSSLAVLLTCLIAAILPAARAARLRPVEAIRHV